MENNLPPQSAADPVASPNVNIPENITGKKPFSKKLITIIGLFLVIGSAFSGVWFLKPEILGNWRNPANPNPTPSPSKGQSVVVDKNEVAIKKFASEKEFKAYLSKASDSSGYGTLGGIPALGSVRRSVPETGISAPSALQAPGGGDGPLERASQTNVQVAGIDEPDIIKTDGNNIFYSQESIYYYLERSLPSAPEIMPPFKQPASKTFLINAFPISILGVKSNIPKSGELLLTNNNLIVFAQTQIFGYDVSNNSNPVEKWQVVLDKNTRVVTSRLLNNKVYLIVEKSVNRNKPCPVVPLTGAGNNLSIPCSDIYHPITEVPVNKTFTVMVLSPVDGKVEKTVSFVGSSYDSVVYMSNQAIYVSYSYQKDASEIIYNFFVEKGKDLIPADSLKKLENLQKYDLSYGAKLMELQQILAEAAQNMGEDEALKFENEMQNRMTAYFKEHSRELEKTGIAKINVPDLSVKATGGVPGTPLNQFSLDEYKGNLRIATTVGRGFGSSESTNDLYVLGEDMNISGSVLDMGKGERIYSARFIDDRGYIVTFKQVDPFYVLNLADPQKPQILGELKIPGYSSYLQPLADNIILGIGKEGSKVKLSLFNVASAQNPIEIDKYILDEYSSESLSNHRAFLIDAKHKVFFLPGSKGGYVFSYNGNKLALKKVVSDFDIKRAVYINDYLYIVGQQKMVVLDEKTWGTIKELSLQ